MDQNIEQTNTKHDKAEKLKHIQNHVLPKLKKVLILLVVLSLVGVGYFYVSNHTDNNRYIGQVEAPVISHKTEVSGKLLEVNISLGEKVKAGQVIAIIDSTDQEYAVAQLKNTLEKAKVSLTNSQVGNANSTAQSNLTIANANLKSAIEASAKVTEDYQNALVLFQEGAIAKNALNNAKFAADTAANAVEAARGAVSVASNPSNSKTLALDISNLEIQIQQMEENLEKFKVVAQCDGTIISKNYFEGDMVNPGMNITDISSEAEKYFVFYVTKEKISNLNNDDEVIVVQSGKGLKNNKDNAVGAGNKECKGKIKYIDVKSQYTPKDFQSAANKNQESFKVKVLLEPGCPLKPGEDAEIIL